MALHLAVEHNDINLVKYLIAKWIDINIKDKTNYTAKDYSNSKEINIIFESIT